MNRAKVFMFLAILALVLTVSCGQNVKESGPRISTGANEVKELSSQALAEASNGALELREQLSFAPSSADSPLGGILVTGTGTITANPDLATINLGVQVTADTVKEALQQANVSLNAMLDVPRQRGIDEKDTQTRHFSINPTYDYQRDGPPLFTGYRVTNQLEIKVRDLANIGPVIDETVTVGGDSVQIHGISFVVEDTSALSAQARESAIKAAITQAKQFADLTEVKLGRLIHISQISGVSPQIRGVPAMAAFDESPVRSTTVRAGETEISVTVQALFSIQ